MIQILDTRQVIEDIAEDMDMSQLAWDDLTLMSLLSLVPSPFHLQKYPLIIILGKFAISSTSKKQTIHIFLNIWKT